MRVLVTGSGGQLATYLGQEFAGHQVSAMSREQLNIIDPTRFDDILRRLEPDVVINTAAFHNLPQCEKDPLTSFQVNACAPFLLGKACQGAGVKLVHVSTDYVFGGDHGAKIWTEHDRPYPQSVYAASKLAGEHLVQQAIESHLIVRTCGLYGARGSAEKNGNFVLTMLRLGRESGEVRVVNDQICAPTFARHLAIAILLLVEGGHNGVFHIVNSGACSWYDFAVEIFRSAGMSVNTRPVRSNEYCDGVRRPHYSVLDCSRYREATGQQIPAWEDGIREYLAEIGEISS